MSHVIINPGNMRQAHRQQKKTDAANAHEYTSLQATLPLPPPNSEFTVLWKDQPFEAVINMVTDRELIETNRQSFAGWLPERSAKGARAQTPGIHLSDDGKCVDFEIAMLVVDVWAACGVGLGDEERHMGVNLNESKKAKDRVEVARRWMSYFANAGNLFEDIEKSFSAMKQGKQTRDQWFDPWHEEVMKRVVAFLHTQHHYLSRSTGIVVAGARRESVRQGNAVALGHARRRTALMASEQQAKVVSMPSSSSTLTLPKRNGKKTPPTTPARPAMTKQKSSAYPPPPPRPEDECQVCACQLSVTSDVSIVRNSIWMLIMRIDLDLHRQQYIVFTKYLSDHKKLATELLVTVILKCGPNKNGELVGTLGLR
jgi:hypothetical protein